MLYIPNNTKPLSDKQYHRTKKNQEKMRFKIINHYTKGKNCCECCGENIINFLTIDHINNDGNKHRKEIKGQNMWSWIIKNNFPEEFRILCYNCNCARGHSECPHKKFIRRIIV